MHNDLCLDGTFATRAFNNSYAFPSSSRREISKIASMLKLKGDAAPIMVPHSGLAKNLMPVFAFIPTLMLVAYTCIVGGVWLPLFFLIFMAAGTFTGKMFQESLPSIFSIFIGVFPLMFYGFIYGMFATLFYMPLYDYCFLIYLAPAWWLFSILVAPFLMGRRMPEANALYGRMRGFKRFLLTAELPRIQLLFDENPDYFADILPWCYIMGISDKVKKRFEPLHVKMPDYVRYGVRISSIANSISRSTGTHSSSHGGGGGGGGHGGSSGGGGGGGGSRAG